MCATKLMQRYATPQNFYDATLERFINITGMQDGEGIPMLCGGLKGPFVDAARCVGKRGKYFDNACVCSTYNTVYTGGMLSLLLFCLNNS